MSDVPWPFWTLAGVLAFFFSLGVVVELVLTEPSTRALLEWIGTGVLLFGAGYLLFRHLSSTDRSFEDRWTDRMTENGDQSDR